MDWFMIVNMSWIRSHLSDLVILTYNIPSLWWDFTCMADCKSTKVLYSYQKWRFLCIICRSYHGKKGINSFMNARQNSGTKGREVWCQRSSRSRGQAPKLSQDWARRWHPWRERKLTKTLWQKFVIFPSYNLLLVQWINRTSLICNHKARNLTIPMWLVLLLL